MEPKELSGHRKTLVNSCCIDMSHLLFNCNNLKLPLKSRLLLLTSFQRRINALHFISHHTGESEDYFIPLISPITGSNLDTANSPFF